MKKKFAILIVVVLGLLVGIGASLSYAQQQQSPDRATIERERAKEKQLAPDRDTRFEIEGNLQGMPPPAFAGDFVFLATEMSFGGKTVKGAPYSAQAVTESVQTLSDGNRIVNKSTAAIYRDSEGRTRREQTIRAVGAFANGGEAPQIVFINDPVTGTSYTLDPRTHTARKMPPMNFKFQFKVPAPGEPKAGAVVEAPPPSDRLEAGRVEIERELGRPELAIKTAPGQNLVWGWRNAAAVSESLGKQNIEGVEAEGTRSTVTIPAGEIGNERPIEIVSERWYSQELQTIVMTRHSDPRFGESSYRLTNIDRSEPARSLFEIPGDYTLKSMGVERADGGVGDTFMYRSLGEISDGVLNGKATNLPLPAYPPIARAANATGKVRVEVTIDEAGNVTEAKAVSGHPLLQAAAVAAARNAKFNPTKVAGQPTKVQGVLIYTFAGQPTQKE
ncbi:MAG TPA: energy transducer TonB [Pyrinomonadaceae bacterium]